MIYRCRKCQYEEARGWLPCVASGLYLMFLLALATGLLALVSMVVRAWLSNLPSNNDSFTTSWWMWCIGAAVGFIIAFASVFLVKFTLEFLEHLVFVRKQCPNCKARNWSWGFTKGFGL